MEETVGVDKNGTCILALKGRQARLLQMYKGKGGNRWKDSSQNPPGEKLSDEKLD